MTTRTDGQLTIAALYDILKAGIYLDANVDLTSEAMMKTALRRIIDDPQKASDLWRAIKDFPRAALELKHANIGLGGKVQR